MQILKWKLCWLSILCVVMYAPAYAQTIVSQQRQGRNLDSVEMLMASPRSYWQSPNPGKSLQTIQNTRSTSVFGDIRAGSIASVSATGCSDTSGRYFLEKTPIFFYVFKTNRAADGAILTAGQYVNSLDNAITGGFLIKSNDKGVVQWTKLYNTTVAGQPFTYCYYYNLLELKGGSLLLAGKSFNPANGHHDLILTHVDKTGSIIWSKTYDSRLWIMDGTGSPDYYYIVDMQEDPATGDIFFTGPHWENGLNVTRMKINDGTIVWSNYYGGVAFDFNIPFGMDIRVSDLFVFSKSDGGNIQRSLIDKAAGTALESRHLVLADISKTYLGFTVTDQLVKMDNGHYLLSGKLYRYYISTYDPDQTSPLAHAGVVEADADFNFIKAWYFSNNTEASYPGTNTRLTIRKDGSGLFSMLGNYTSAEIYVQFKFDQLLGARVLSYQGESIVSENRSVQTADSGELVIKHLRNWTTDKGRIEFLNLHLSDTSSDCLGQKDNSNFIYPYQLKPSNRNMEPASPNDFKESVNRAITVSTIDLDYTTACTQVRGCDTLSLVKNTDTVCINSPFNFTVRKNPSCMDSVLFDYQAAQVQSFSRVNDSLYSFNFKTPGTATIYGNITGCALLKDSVKVMVVAASGKIDLGADTAICPGNTIVLHTQPGFSSYTWQDGSKDTLFAVKQPGLYFVTVVDFCGNILTDTVTVSAGSPLAFDLGADTSLCAKDSIVLKAPASFTNYRWWPNYYISSLTAQTVFVSPQADTIYHLSFESSPGCWVEDSLRVHVNHAAPINLGADRSLCAGDSLVLDAGPGFLSYHWSNGIGAQFITVYNAGLYAVTAIGQEGCKASDTMRVVTVFPNPKPELGTDSIICAGTQRIISPGGTYAQYAWNTGSTASAIAVSKTGLYTVMVADKNNCKGADSLVITRIVNPPANFLPADTAICTYGKLDLRPNTSFNNYAWSTGASSAVISIASAGTYWLEVKDNNCIGRDSIIIKSGDCMTGFYIPNAFTPGHDGKNDTFKPLIFGNLLQYEFTVYNRFGQMIFTTREARKGWDGTPTQSANAFAWTCRYQRENEPVRFEKGMVLLLK